MTDGPGEKNEDSGPEPQPFEARRRSRASRLAAVIRQETKFFVSMPFETKIDTWRVLDVARRLAREEGADNALTPEQALEALRAIEPIDFDAIYGQFIRSLFDDLKEFKGVTPQIRRGDETPEGGSIHRTMIEDLIVSDVVLIDISSGNANVFWEAGVRHAAQRSGSILLIRQGDEIPFNLRGMRLVHYPRFSGEIDLLHGAAAEDAQKALDQLAGQIIEALRRRADDSLVHQMAPGLNIRVPASPLRPRKVMAPDLQKTPAKKRIGYVEGDLLDVDFMDVWVNPENTKFDMARHHDGSVSAVIRYYGAKRDRSGAILEDTVYDALQKQLHGAAPGRRGRSRRGPVAAGAEPGTAIITTSGSLAGDNHRVRAIAHIAAQHGMPARGFRTVDSIKDCIHGALDRIDAASREMRTPLKSVLIPMFGTRNADRDPDRVAIELFQSAQEYLLNWKDVQIEEVFFLAFDTEDRRLCQKACAAIGVTPGEDAARLDQKPAAETYPPRWWARRPFSRKR